MVLIYRISLEMNTEREKVGQHRSHRRSYNVRMLTMFLQKNLDSEGKHKISYVHVRMYVDILTNIHKIVMIHTLGQNLWLRLLCYSIVNRLKSHFCDRNLYETPTLPACSKLK